MRRLLFTFLFLSLCVAAGAQDVPSERLYGCGSWNADSLGNHRVVVRVDKPSDAVLARIQWRRRDLDPQGKDIVVVDAATGERITNVCRFNVTREAGEIAFQPKTVPGDYYVYYLRNVMSGSRAYPTVKYPPFQETASQEWIRKNKLSGKKAPKLPLAEVVQFQAIDQMNSFYPMEVIATAAEKERLLAGHPGEKYIVFTEDRRFPIRMTTDIPYKWIADDRHDSFTGQADKGEYYVFQIGVWAARADIGNLHVGFSQLVNKANGEQIPSASFTCFNTEGVDVKGTYFEKECAVKQGKVQALWIGTQLPERMSSGTYEGTLTVSAPDAETKSVHVVINVSDNVIANHGDDEPWRHSRLRWLNSRIGFDDEVIAPYTPLVMKGKTIGCLGRDVTLSPLGLPASITSYFKETMTGIGTEGRPVLAAPIELAADGGSWENLSFDITKNKQGARMEGIEPE